MSDDSGEIIFVETTVLADRIFAHPQIKKRIKSALADKRLISSRYVWEQFCWTFLYSESVFWLLLRQTGNFNEACIALSHYIPGVRTTLRLVQRIYAVLGLVPEPITTAGILRLLEYHIRMGGLRGMFFKGLCRPLIDGMSCQRTRLRWTDNERTEYDIDLEKETPIKVECRQDDPPDCDIQQFWRNHLASLQMLSDWDVDNDPLVAHDNCCDLGKVRDVARETLTRIQENDPQGGVGLACWAKLADAIICLESPEDARIVTTDMKDFRPLCALFGRKEPFAP